MAGLFGQSERKNPIVKWGKIEITPRIIDFDHRVVQLSEVASSEVDHIHPWRWAVVPVAALGIGLIYTGGTSSYDLYTGASSGSGAFLKFLGFIALIVAVALLFVREQFLLISTSDGRYIRIKGQEKFLIDILSRIKLAMSHEPNSDVKYVVDLGAGTINIGSVTVDQRSTSVVNSPGAIATAGDIKSSVVNGDGRAAAHGANGKGAARAEPAPTVPAAVQKAPAAAAQPSASVTNSPGSISVGGSIVSSQVRASVETTANRDLEALIGLIQSRDIQHQQQLVNLLQGIQGHVRAKGARHPETKASWASFADYALKYLGHVDGVLALVERIGKYLLI